MLERLIRSPLGALTQGPFVDPMALFALRRLFFPLSRMWAASALAGDSVPEFVRLSGLTAVQGRRERLVAKLLARSGEIHRSAAATEAAWRAAFFDDAAKSNIELAAIEARRLEAAHRATLDRLSYYPLLWNGKAHKLSWKIPTQDDVEQAYGAFLPQPEAAYDLPNPLPEVERSPAIAGRLGKTYWLRFASPSARMADMAYARVMEPEVENPPTIVIGNGVCMEPENVRDLVDASTVMCRLGFRVIEITTPWHARRCRTGDYGGERFFATAPMGQIDLFTAQAKETGVLIDWCKRNFDAPVVLAGISLGSFVAQLVAAHSAHWPEKARPDALLLITHTGKMEEVVFESGLVEGIGIPAALEKAGWSQAQMLRWAPLMDPPGAPALPASRIVSVLGMTDRVTPVGGGLDLVKRWGVPAENLFVERQGHFGAAVKLVRDDSPLRRVQEIVRGI
ncbi:MAG: hypothetical protein K0S54_1528 [Alphaproteobacteria bacterium]|jgi:hypothetical protein|nr:hypothetical protein [Alphaproteobacteria bacterium]